MRRCILSSLEDQFNFGKFNGLSLADVLDINPSYLSWCIKYCTGVIFQLEDTALEEIKIVYPNFIMDALFESKRIWHLNRYDSENKTDDIYLDDDFFISYSNLATYDRYAGSWVQDIEGYSDDEIDANFDGDVCAYWNND